MAIGLSLYQDGERISSKKHRLSDFDHRAGRAEMTVSPSIPSKWRLLFVTRGMSSERAHAAMNASAVAIGRPRASAAFEICAYERHTCKLDGTTANRRTWVASSAIRRGPQSFLYAPRYISPP